ncbi:hypothetical protein Mal15_32500 [Stieleria maiorica]|uniref:Uncharacterized protein n=1 Tax=Stieleria maiorica TaxID=2795974 RepID=A0A5B9MGN5_9BACT|nr:hypothetical protein Mal15_32500 [Stieleria maiorica]
MDGLLIFEAREQGAMRIHSLRFGLVLSCSLI